MAITMGKRMKTAVFYDLENVVLTGPAVEYTIAFDSLLRKLKTSELVGDIVLHRGYISKNHSAFEKVREAAERHGIELVAVDPIIDDGRGKPKPNMVDFKMSVDIIATLSSRRSITTVVMASGDNDFGFTCQQIKAMGKKLLVISHSGKTGGALLSLCDDWIDINGQPIQQKLIVKSIETRIRADYSNGDFFECFDTFLRALEGDLLIRRFMARSGLMFSTFMTILYERLPQFPKFRELGFVTITHFMEVMLSGTIFECRGGMVKYCDGSRPLSQKCLIEKVLNLPGGYSREKLLKYYDVVDSLDNVDEMLQYIGFMRRCGMLKGNKLCYRRTFRATIRKYIRSLITGAGLTLDEEAMAEINEKL